MEQADGEEMPSNGMADQKVADRRRRFPPTTAQKFPVGACRKRGGTGDVLNVRMSLPLTPPWRLTFVLLEANRVVRRPVRAPSPCGRNVNTTAYDEIPEVVSFCAILYCPGSVQSSDSKSSHVSFGSTPRKPSPCIISLFHDVISGFIVWPPLAFWRAHCLPRTLWRGSMAGPGKTSLVEG